MGVLLISFAVTLLELSSILFLTSFVEYITTGTISISIVTAFLDLVKAPFNLVYLIGVVVLISYLLKNGLSVLLIYLQIKFATSVEASTSTTMFTNYLNLPYETFLGLKASSILKDITKETQIFSSCILNLLFLFSNLLLFITILIYLFIMNLSLTIFFGLLLSVILWCINRITRKGLFELGTQREKLNKEQFNIADRSLSDFKSIKIYDLIRYFSNRYLRCVTRAARVSTVSETLSSVPKNLIELLVIFVIVGLVFLAMYNKVTSHNIVSMIVIYILALQRLLPTSTNILKSIMKLRFFHSSITIVYDSLALKNKAEFKQKHETKMNIEEKIRLENLSYSYPSVSKDVLNNINLDIRKDKSIAIIGESGSGKTTFINLIISLLYPRKGKVWVDKDALNPENLFSYRKMIGYVPQDVILFNDTISENIILNGRDDTPGREKVIRVAKASEIHDYIVSLKDGYDAKVGDKGSNLSGGQRQRIGIARALYKDPSILVLDEATNSLDSQTEEKIMNNILSMPNKFIIIMVAHRLSTIVNFDKIVVISQSKVEDVGSHFELLKRSSYYRKMCTAQKII